MSTSFIQNMAGMLLAMGVGGWALFGGIAPVRAQCPCPMHEHGGSGAGEGAAASGHQHAAGQGDPAGDVRPEFRPPHAGQVASIAPFSLEVVYQPQQIRVYLYSPGGQPLSAQGAQGEIAMQVRNDARVWRAPLEYVAPPAEGPREDYLAAAVNLTRVRDGDMTVTFTLTGLPSAQRPSATFAQTFALTRSRPQVVLAALGEGDRAGIAAQQVCPVTGARLGAMGDPVKVLVGDQPLYLCCRGCLSKVQSAPEQYLAKARQASQGR